MTSNSFSRQIQNRNFLSPTGFQFNLVKCPKVSFLCVNARIPEVSLDLTIQPSYLKNIDVPGEKLTYGDLNLKFLVDENLENYMQIHNWITGLGFPESTEQYSDLSQNDNGDYDEKQQFSDGSLTILNSNFRANAIVKFVDLFPISLSSLEFDSSLGEASYFTADVTFKYTVYNILDADGRTPL